MRKFKPLDRRRKELVLKLFAYGVSMQGLADVFAVPCEVIEQVIRRALRTQGGRT